MTVGMDVNKNHRRSSWESKMSCSTMDTSNRRYRKSPSSIISSDSDIRFTRRKLTSQTRCGCCIIATFLLFLLLAAASVYVGYTYFLPETPGEETYRGSFRIIEGDTFSAELADPSTTKFKNTSRDYRERLNLLFRRSLVKQGYRGSEVLALDGTEDKDLIIHFDIRIDPNYVQTASEDLEAIIAKEITLEGSILFKNLTVDLGSLEVQPSDALPQMMTTSTYPTTIFSDAVVTYPTYTPRSCAPLALKYCSSLGYNVTTYPNVFGHKSLKEVRDNVISFRELVDAECYRHAYEFVCQLLQPGCIRDNGEDRMVLPCRSFCRDFMGGCGERLNDKVRSLIDCSKFPEFSSGERCYSKPGCVDDLKSKAHSPRICDGTIDCTDLSDEKSCTYCSPNQIHCGIGRTCIRKAQQCDGREDCPDGSDERACLTLLPAQEETVEQVSPHEVMYHPEGFVTFKEKGEGGKLCTENLNKTLSENKTEDVLRTVAVSLCKSLTYQDMQSYQVIKDPHPNTSYVRIKDPFADDITFLKSKCPSKQVLKVSCDQLECGIQSTHSKTTRMLQKMASHGDWPWHVALFKNDVHLCDGILLSSHWLATSTSCFQGQPRAEWTARFGVVRLSSDSPWEQERRIIGMLKSPVEGSTVSLIRLEQPVHFNDFVRPVCLPEKNLVLTGAMQCNTLGWARNREQLQRVQVKITDKDKCENVSISSVNSVCTETIHGQNDCGEEEFAGSSMVCRTTNTDQWTLVGVTNWRIACGKNGMERPRVYDLIASNVEWIRETINSVNST
ncbi:atrial natriuretic peptide-converting enzyme-like [Anthonomus grandis grandis]|uniref:atrial natriuretic peptide-converting enzyme-like n=1 Tax=Anthonomus grandis grandis TaxID=2921223 RepID=UPI002166691D|nr:atrial natriuretic peptide-converting enzyme-like [Anthonomus grandis grandis]